MGNSTPPNSTPRASSHPFRWLRLRRRWRQGWPRRLASFLLALLLSVGLGQGVPLLAQEAPSAEADAETLPALPPRDVDDYWAGDCLQQLAAAGLVIPNDQGQVFPNAPITWGDYIELLNQVFPTGAGATWMSPLEQALGLERASNLASNYPRSYYQPNAGVQRDAAIMALAAKQDLPYVIRANGLIEASLDDATLVTSITREGVAAALAQGRVVAYPNPRQIRPRSPLTRGEAAALVCRSAPQTALRRTISPDWVTPAAALEAQPVPQEELRGVWLTNIDSEVLFSQDNLTAGVERLDALNFNTLYPTVWNWGYTLFPSATAERELGASQRLHGENSTPQRENTQTGRDMLQELIDLAHPRGMKVIPWFEFCFMTPAPYVLYDEHPDWFTQRAATVTTPGEDTVTQAPDVGEVDPTALPDDPGIWLEGGRIPRRWLNPFHPRAQQFLLQILDELLTNYDIDGLQMDDHLGLPVDFGYDPYTTVLYQRDHDGTPPPSNPKDPEWVRWRADKITAFLAEVHQLVKSRRPDAVMSISPNPYPFSYANYLQDWPTWVEAGLVDELLIQIYRSDQERFIWEMNKPTAVNARRATTTVTGILSGLRATPVGMEFITEQIAAARDRDFDGVSFFFYESLWSPPPGETLEQRLELLQEAFPNPAQHP